MERDNRIDFLKSIGIFCVVLGHSGSAFAAYVYTFHMPLFFFITGYLRYNKEGQVWKEYIFNKIKKILIPYFAFWIMSMVVYNEIYSIFVNGYIDKIGINQIKGLIFGGHWLADYSNNFPIWYLQLLFLASLMFEFIIKYFNTMFKICITFAFAVATIPFQEMLPGRPIFHINVLPAAVVFMMFGYCFHYIIDIENSKKISIKSCSGTVGILLLMIGWQISTLHYGNISSIESYFYFGGATCTIVGLFIIGKWFDNFKIMNYVGKKTLYIMGLHNLVFFAARNIVNYITENIGISNDIVKKF